MDGTQDRTPEEETGQEVGCERTQSNREKVLEKWRERTHKTMRRGAQQRGKDRTT